MFVATLEGRQINPKEHTVNPATIKMLLDAFSTVRERVKDYSASGSSGSPPES